MKKLILTIMGVVAIPLSFNITDNEVYNTKSRPSAFRTRFILLLNQDSICSGRANMLISF
jgi:hypothetical protein